MKRLTYLCLVCTLAIGSAAHAATVRTVALSGQHAPGTPSGVNYSSFNPPRLNDAGQTAFIATLNGSGTGIWSEGSGGLALVARSGQPAPDTPSGVIYSDFNGVGGVVLNDAGHTAFRALLGGGVDFTNGVGFWSDGSGNLALVARAGSQAPGTPSGVNYSYFAISNTPRLNDAGQIAFYAELTGSGVDSTNNGGIWSEGSGGLALVARSGEPAPGTPSGVSYGTAIGSPFGFPVLNDAGQTAFSAYLTGSGVDLSNQHGIWSERSGSLALVARSGQPAPGTPSGVAYGQFVSPPALNNAGQTAFLALLGGSGVNSTNDRGIWSEGSGSLALVVRNGSQAPGTPSGVNYLAFSSSPVLNDAGQTAFSAYLTGSGLDFSNDQGIWSEGSGSLALVVREGSQAPGTASGVNFSFQSSDSPALNNAGQTAFFSFLIGNGVDSTNNRSIWATDRTGALQLIARSGDPLEVAPGDFRTISFLSIVGGTGNSDGRASGFNNLGQLAFRASFTDGSAGAFVSNLVAVPEPSSLVLAALSLVPAFACSRRRSRTWMSLTA